MDDPLKVIRYEAAGVIAFGPLSEYRALVSDDCSDLAIRTGIQTCRPGYEAKPHWHPYVEILHILDGAAEAWEVGQEQFAVILRAGDTVVIPARTWHSFRVAGEQTLRLLGTHLSSQRIVHYDDGSTCLGVSSAAGPLICSEAQPSVAADATQVPRR
jgi:mannose-6-phosphate isomerase-like protein (cupin superfamily)